MMKKNKIDIPSWEIETNESYFEKVNSIDDIRNNFINYSGVEPYGFIYVVEFSNGKLYIGKKNFYRELNVKKGKRELSQMTDKRGSKKKKVIKESDWKTYYGSFKNEELSNGLNSGEVKIDRRFILSLATTKSQLTYLETKYLFSESVLEDDRYLNDNILGKFYRGKILG